MASFEFLLAMCVYRDTIYLFHVHLMVICKENHLNTMVSIYRCKRNPPYDTLFGGRAGFKSLEQIAAKLREEFLFEVRKILHNFL